MAFDNTSAAVAPRFLVTFAGSLADTDVPLITASGSELQYATVTPRLVTNGRSPRGESQIVTLTKPTTDGSFTLSLTHNSTTCTTSAIAFDATTADVQSAIAAAISPITGATATVTYFNGTEIHITFAGRSVALTWQTSPGRSSGMWSPPVSRKPLKVSIAPRCPRSTRRWSSTTPLIH
ncbi:MAG UNVERIFIED_CONTAM: hypothetical protein LVR18_51290 [Planctomycetaceae bacterium]